MNVDDLFAGTSDEPSHPRLRDWKKRIVSGQSATLELYRPPTTIGLSRTKMYIHFELQDKSLGTDEADWEQVLNDGLIGLKVRAKDQTNESQRFTLGLRDGLQTMEKEFGNGYFNSVLLDLVVESDLQRHPEIASVLKFTYHDNVDRSTKSYDRCRDGLALGIGARAKELTRMLGYPQEEATAILTTALARYLDERFSVSSRKQFGLLS